MKLGIQEDASHDHLQTSLLIIAHTYQIESTDMYAEYIQVTENTISDPGCCSRSITITSTAVERALQQSQAAVNSDRWGLLRALFPCMSFSKV